MIAGPHKALPWTPPSGADAETIEAGRYWDAIRAPAAVGERALALLGGKVGAVIADYNVMYWLTLPGAAGSWHRIRGVEVLGSNPARTTIIGVPPATRTGGQRLHWRIPLGPGRYLTDAGLLREALVRAAVAELGPSEEETVL